MLIKTVGHLACFFLQKMI